MTNWYIALIAIMEATYNTLKSGLMILYSVRFSDVNVGVVINLKIINIKYN